jgi:predicted ABC-type transport system involved in lysophospholipase L1 biosynthesis ATPase subunit
VSRVHRGEATSKHRVVARPEKIELCLIARLANEPQRVGAVGRQRLRVLAKRPEVMPLDHGARRIRDRAHRAECVEVIVRDDRRHGRTEVRHDEQMIGGRDLTGR